MGLETVQIPEKLDPQKASHTETILERHGRYVVTKAYHGPVFEGKERPQYIRFNVIDSTFDDRIIKKQSYIISENEQGYVDQKDEIIHTAQVMNGMDGYFEREY